MNDGAYLGDEVLDGSMKIFHNRVFAVLVDNEPGTLARIVGLFSGRGYNIDSLTVTEVDPAERVSRLTLVTSGTLPVLQQIRAQLERLVPVRKVQDLSAETRFLARELALVKVAGRGRKRPRGFASGRRVQSRNRRSRHRLFHLSAYARK